MRDFFGESITPAKSRDRLLRIGFGEAIRVFEKRGRDDISLQLA